MDGSICTNNWRVIRFVSSKLFLFRFYLAFLGGYTNSRMTIANVQLKKKKKKTDFFLSFSVDLLFFFFVFVASVIYVDSSMFFFSRSQLNISTIRDSLINNHKSLTERNFYHRWRKRKNTNEEMLNDNYSFASRMKRPFLLHQFVLPGKKIFADELEIGAMTDKSLNSFDSMWNESIKKVANSFPQISKTEE